MAKLRLHVSWAGMSVHKIFIFLLPCFVIIAFCQFLTLRSMGLDWLLLILSTSHIQNKRIGIYYLTHYQMQVVLFLFKNNSFQLVLFPITLYFYLLIHYSWCSELITGHCDKTKILNSKNMIFKGRNFSLVNFFCRH